MNIEYFQNQESLTQRGASIVLEEIRRKKDLLLCAATGESPRSIYDRLIRESKKEDQLFQNLRIIKLDEWWGVPSGSNGTCEEYLRSCLLGPLAIPDKRYISFASDVTDPVQECNRIRSLLKRQGPIDLTILGLGRNGHIGLNEPGNYFEPYCHLQYLSEQSRQHEMMKHLEEKPAYGLTLGMAEILSSRKIILIISGEDKTDATRMLLSGHITTDCPATFLWLHNHVICLVLQLQDSS